MTVHQEVDSWHGEATAHERLATVLDRVGQTESAVQHWNSAVELYDKLGDPRADDILGRVGTP